MLRRDFLKYLSGLPFIGGLFATGESVASEGQSVGLREFLKEHYIYWGSDSNNIESYFHYIDGGYTLMPYSSRRISNIDASKADNVFQLHWQFKDGKHEVWSQSEINSKEEMAVWFKDVAEKHPLPEGAQWLVCNTKSKYFVWVAPLSDEQKISQTT